MQRAVAHWKRGIVAEESDVTTGGIQAREVGMFIGRTAADEKWRFGLRVPEFDRNSVGRVGLEESDDLAVRTDVERAFIGIARDTDATVGGDHVC